MQGNTQDSMIPAFISLSMTGFSHGLPLKEMECGPVLPVPPMVFRVLWIGGLLRPPLFPFLFKTLRKMSFSPVRSRALGDVALLLSNC